MLELVQAAGEKAAPSDPVPITAVYSFAITNYMATLNIHWAHKDWDSRVQYHMHEIRAYGLSPTTDGIFEQRHDLNNLLEWMLGERLTSVKSLIERIQRAGSPLLESQTPMQAYDDDSEEQDNASRRPVEDTPEDYPDKLNPHHSVSTKRKKRGE